MQESAHPKKIRLVETFRNLFYTPVYAAVGGGFFYRHGLSVLFNTAPAERGPLSMLRDGSADIVQTGISRSLMALDEGDEEAPLHFAEINRRDGFFVLSRRPVEEWSWRRLEGAALIPVGFTPVPWMSLRRVLSMNGVDVGRVRLLPGLTAEEAMDRFRTGKTEYVHLPHPQAQELIDEGTGHLAAAVGPALGHICYSSFASSPSLLRDSPGTVDRFVLGFYDAQRWIASHGAAEIADAVSPFFADRPLPQLERAIQVYKRQETWAEDPLIREEGFTAMRDLLIDGGLVERRHEYDRLVRPGFAQRAMADLTSP